MLRDHFTAHYTPKHGSWLNQAVIEVGLLNTQCQEKRRLTDLVILRHEARAWKRRLNSNGTIIEWNFTRKQAQ